MITELWWEDGKDASLKWGVGTLSNDRFECHRLEKGDILELWVRMPNGDTEIREVKVERTLIVTGFQYSASADNNNKLDDPVQSVCVSWRGK